MSHSAVPVVFFIVPPTQAVQGPPAGPMYPVLQTQSVNASLMTCDDEYAGQTGHAADPVLDLYVPAAHPVHMPPLGPVYPALHTQSDT